MLTALPLAEFLASSWSLRAGMAKFGDGTGRGGDAGREIAPTTKKGPKDFKNMVSSKHVCDTCVCTIAFKTMASKPVNGKWPGIATP
jgi:hypothetical protein